MLRGFSLQIYPTARQARLLKQHCIATRILYNATIVSWKIQEFRHKAFKHFTGKTPYQYRKDLVDSGDTTFLKEVKIGKDGKEVKVTVGYDKPTYTDFTNLFPWMTNLSSVIRREAVKDANTAFDKFFNGLKKGQKVGYPCFKNKRAPFRCRHMQPSQLSLIGEGLYATGIKLYPFDVIKLSRSNWVPLKPLKIVQAAFAQRANKWFVSITLELPDQEKPQLQDGLKKGIDLGARNIVGTKSALFPLSNRQIQYMEKLNREQEKWSRKISRRFKKGEKQQSQGFFEAKYKLQQIHLSRTNLMNDVRHKITTRVVASNEEQIVIEDLAIKNMMANKRIAPLLQQIGMAEVRSQIVYKAKTQGKKLFEVDRFYPSSQTCPQCGNIKGRDGTKKLGSQRIYHCEKCDFNGDRDKDVAPVNLENAPEKVLTEI